MALNFRKFLDGIRVIPKTTSTANEKGELDVTDSTGKLNYHNGTSSSPVVTEAHSATLTNKTLENAIILGNTSADALRITQTGSGNALLVEDSTNPDATPFVINASGNVGIGTASPAARLEVENGTGVRTSYNANADDLAIDGPANTGITISSANNAIGSILFADNDSDLRGAVQYTHTTNALYLSTDGSERLRIDSIGRVLVGSTSARNIGTSLVSSSIQVEGTNTNNSSILAYGNTNTSTGSGILVLGKSRGTAVGSVTAVQNGDSLGLIHFMGADGTSGGVTGAFIIGQVDGTVATNVMPGALTFWTTPASSNTPIERLRIDSSGNVGIATSSPSSTFGGIDIASGGLSLVIGAQQGSSARANATTKIGRIGGYHYTNVEEPFLAILTESTSTANNITIGGGSGLMNAATTVQFYTAANTTTTTGTERLRIDSSGNVGLNTTNPTQYLHVASRTAGDSPTILVSNDGTGTGNATLLLQRNSADFGRIRHNPGGGNQTMEFVATHSTTPGYRFYTSLDGTTLTERMRIDSSGNVGIATPGATTLDVNGNVSIRSSNNAQTGSAVTLTAPTTSFVRLTAAVTSVAGITAGANGQTLTLSNRSGGTVAINDEDATATAANRIRTGSGASFNLSNNASIQLAYDSTTSRWMVVGTASSTTSVVSVSIDTVLTSLNDVVLVSASGAARTITLPTPISGKTITVKKTDSSANAVTISRSSTETIDGNNSVTLSAQYDSYTMVSDGTNWFII